MVLVCVRIDLQCSWHGQFDWLGCASYTSNTSVTCQTGTVSTLGCLSQGDEIYVQARPLVLLKFVILCAGKQLHMCMYSMKMGILHTLGILYTVEKNCSGEVFEPNLLPVVSETSQWSPEHSHYVYGLIHVLPLV